MPARTWPMPGGPRYAPTAPKRPPDAQRISPAGKSAANPYDKTNKNSVCGIAVPCAMGTPIVRPVRARYNTACVFAGVLARIDGDPRGLQKVLAVIRTGFTLMELPFDKLSITQPGNRRAFTLIELLVVIAIISLLVAILMPSLERAHELAQLSACFGNIRAIGLGAVMYTGEYDGYLLPFAYDWWCASLAEGRPQGILLSGDYCSSPQVYYCPTLPKRPVWFDQPMTKDFLWPKQLSGYLTRSDYGDTYPVPRHDTWYGYYRIYRIDDSNDYGPNDQKSYVSDYIRPSWDFNHTVFPQLLPDHLIHNNGWAVWYLDGHARHVPYDRHIGIEPWFPTPWRRVWAQLYDVR